jgi:hypothetical protein
MPYSDSIDTDSSRSVAPFAAALNVMYARPRSGFVELGPDDYEEVADTRPNFNDHWKGEPLPLEPAKPRRRTTPLSNSELQRIPVDTKGSLSGEIASLSDAKVPAHVERLFERGLHENGYSRGEIHGHGNRQASLLSRFGGHFAAVATPHLKAAAERRATPDEVSDLLRESIGRLQQGGAMGMLPLPSKPFEAPDDAVIDLEEAPVDLKLSPQYKGLETRRLNDSIARQTLHGELLKELGIPEADWQPLYDKANTRASNPLADHLVRQFKQRLQTEKRHPDGSRRRVAAQLHKQLFGKGQVKKLQRRRYAAERDNPLLDEAFADEAPAAAKAKSQPTGDLFADFDAAESLPDRPRAAAAPRAKRTPAATNPKTAISPKSLHAKQIIEPLRGTRLAYHLMDTIRRYGNVDPDVRPDLRAIADRATAALTGRPHPENDDHFTAVGRMLSEVGDNLGSAYHWGRVKQSLAVDTAVRKWMDTQIVGKTGEEPISKLAARYLVDKQSHPKKAAQQKTLLKHLQQFVGGEIGHSHPDADLSFEKLRRSITRLAGRDADMAEIGAGPRTRKSWATGYVDRRADGSVGAHAVRTDNLPWREYMAMLPGGTSAERYQRLRDRVVRYASSMRALKEARQRYVERQRLQTDDELLPKVEAIISGKGPTSATALAARLHVPAHRIHAVVEKGEADGRLQRQSQRTGSRGPAGTMIDLAPKKMQRRNAMKVKYSRVDHKELAALLNGVAEAGPHQSLPSLVLADWFEENEMPAHAAAVRSSVELTHRMHYPAGSKPNPKRPQPQYATISHHRSDPDGLQLGDRTRTVYVSTGSAGVLRMSGPHHETPDGSRRVRVDYPLHGLSDDHIKEIQKEEVDSHQSQPERYAAYKAPAGGMTVQGVFYPGGSMIPDVGKVRDDAPLAGRASPTPTGSVPKVSSKQRALETIRSRLKRK